MIVAVTAAVSTNRARREDKSPLSEILQIGPNPGDPDFGKDRDVDEDGDMPEPNNSGGKPGEGRGGRGTGFSWSIGLNLCIIQEVRRKNHRQRALLATKVVCVLSATS